MRIYLGNYSVVLLCATKSTSGPERTLDGVSKSILIQRGIDPVPVALAQMLLEILYFAFDIKSV
jgi:hypothetical protein